MRYLKRALLSGLITLAAFAAAAAPASACSTIDGDHCYSVGYGWANSSDFHNEGVMGGVCTETMALNVSNNFITNEIWDVQPDTTGWVEAGVFAGTIRGVPTASSPTLFWADKSAKYGFTSHTVSGLDPNGITVVVHIWHDTGNWWFVQFSKNNWFSAAYHSWQDSGSGNVIQAGTENGGGFANEAGAVGTGARIQWRDTSGNWHEALTQPNHVITANAGLLGTWGSGIQGRWWEHSLNHAYPTTC